MQIRQVVKRRIRQGGQQVVVHQQGLQTVHPGKRSVGQGGQHVVVQVQGFQTVQIRKQRVRKCGQPVSVKTQKSQIGQTRKHGIGQGAQRIVVKPQGFQTGQPRKIARPQGVDALIAEIHRPRHGLHVRVCDRGAICYAIHRSYDGIAHNCRAPAYSRGPQHERVAHGGCDAIVVHRHCGCGSHRNSG